MKCPNCKFVFKNPAQVAGGKKSRRALTAEQARAMVKAREERKMNIPHKPTKAELIDRYHIVGSLLRTAEGEQRRLLLIEQGVILSIINPTINPLA